MINDQFMDKIQKNDELFQKFKENNKRYQTHLSLLKHTTYPQDLIDNCPFAYAGHDKTGKHIIFVYTSIFPEHNHPNYEKAIRFFIQIMEDKFLTGKHYYFVVFQTGLFKSSKLNLIKDILCSMPEKYFFYLESFYVIHASFIVKTGSFFRGSELINFLKKKTIYVDSLLELSKYPLFTYRILDKIKPYVKQSDLSYKDITIIRQKTIQKLRRTGQFTPETLEEDFDNQEEIEKLAQSHILGQSLDKYEFNARGIPLILDILLNYFQQNPEYYFEEGIFRKQASRFQEKILEGALACKKIKFIEKIENPNIVAGVIKQFFLQLDGPLVPYEIYDMIIQKSKGELPKENQVDFARYILYLLPEQNRLIFSVTIGFLRRVSQYSEKNKMTSNNLAIIFAPTFFKPKQVTMMDFKYLNFFIGLVDISIKDYSTLFENIQFQEYLTSEIPQRKASLIPYLDMDCAKIEDLIDMIGGQQKFKSQEYILEEEIADLKKIQQDEMDQFNCGNFQQIFNQK